MMRRILFAIFWLLCVGCGGLGLHSKEAMAHTYETSVLVLTVVDQVEAQYLSSLETPTPEQLASATVRVARLREIRDTLALARVALTTTSGQERLTTAVALLLRAAQAAQAAGLRLPPETASALELLHRWARETVP